MLRMLEARQGPTPADILWDIAKKNPDSNFRSKGFMKQILLQLRKDSFVKTVCLGDNFGYQLSENYRQKLRKAARGARE